MRPVRIITDSCADLTGELLTKWNIGYARMNTVYKGKQTPASLTWEHFTPKEMYDIMRSEKSAEDRITTTQVPVEEFMRVFTECLDAGADIVYIGCATKQSGSVNTGMVVAKQLMEKNPEATIICIDALNACVGEGMLAIEAAKLRDQGLDAKAIADRILPMRNTVNEYITVNTLDYLKRAGRVKGSAAFFGNLLGVKPILIADANGAQTPIKKVKGRSNSITELVNLLKESIVKPEEQTVYIVHADCDESEIMELKVKIREEICPRDICVIYIGPIIGASIGPDAIGVFGFGKEVTYQVQA